MQFVWKKTFVVGAITALLWAGLAPAQTAGTLRGKVSDPLGAVIPGAKVRCLADSGGTTRSVETDMTGEYQCQQLPAGTYRVEITSEGFKTLLRRGIEIHIGAVAVVDAKLELGEMTQTVTAEAAAPVVETSSTQIGAVNSARSVTQLPLSSRDTYQLLQLQPGVQSQVGIDMLYGSDRAGVVSINGGRGRSNNYSVNGGDGNDLYANLPGIQPTPDTIQEIRVLTNTFDAEYGRNSGGQINVVTKSGTNQVHGSFFEFFRNRALNSRGFFDTVKPAFNQNQFGFTLGGPIRKDKTFYFGSFEGSRVREGIASDVLFVPTAPERMGDFSAGAPFQGAVANEFLADALNRRPGCASAIAQRGGLPVAAGTPWAAIFRGNRIPTQCFDQTAQDLMSQFVPLPNIGDRFFQSVPVARTRADQFTFRADHSLDQFGQLSFYYYGTARSFADPFTRLQDSGANVPGFGSLNDELVQQWNLSHTWAVSPTAVNEARFAFYRQGMARFVSPQRSHLVRDSCAGVPAEFCFSDPSNPALGIHPGVGPANEGVPFIGISGGFRIGNNYQGEIPQTINTFHLVNNYSRIVGKHTMKFGVDARRQRYAMTNFGALNGQYDFFGGGPNDLGFQNLFPNYLLGIPDFFYQTAPGHADFRSTNFSLFAQDSWRVTPGVTVNFGLRWELATPPGDRFGKVQAFRPGQFSDVYPCELAPGNPLIATFGSTDCRPGGPAEAVYPIGMVVPGDRDIANSLTQTYYKAFAPRFGLAWSPQWDGGMLGKLTGGPGNTSIRTGWGIFYNAPIEGIILAQFAPQPPFGGSSGIYNPMFNTPFVNQDGQAFANPFDGFLDPPRNQPVDWSVFRPLQMYGQFGPDLRTQYSAHYNLMIQRKLGNDTVIQVGYVGSQGHRLLATRDLNYGVAQTCLDLNTILGPDTCGPFQADRSYFIPKGTIPEGVTLHLPYGSVPTVTGPNPTDITLVGLRAMSSPFCEPTTGQGCPPDGIPVYASIFQRDTFARSAYNSFQFMAERRFARGFQFQTAYTWSKSIDNASSFENVVNPLNHRLSRSLSLFDSRHRFVASYVWELPFAPRSGAGGKLVNGWAVSGITTFQTGFPIRISSFDDMELMSSFDFEMPGQPDIVAPFRTMNPRGAGNRYFNPATFAPAEMGRIGTAPRTICCGPPINNFDFAVHKSTMLRKERLRLEFRGEAFNIFNHAQFFNPGGNISETGDFGRVRRARPPRLVQFALKLHF
ncbi:MAG: carboxypeptidase regulatory-like domain-containing protein [Bryobacteraceae bacterium]